MQFPHIYTCNTGIYFYPTKLDKACLGERNSSFLVFLNEGPQLLIVKCMKGVQISSSPDPNLGQLKLALLNEGDSNLFK